MENNVNTEYELLTRSIYAALLRQEGYTVDVKHNVKLKGKTTSHQIDVYWKYVMGGVEHQTIIECKNYKNPVPKEKIHALKGVLDDLDNTSGIFVARNGFQKGAKEYAQGNAIKLIEIRKPNPDDWKGRVKKIKFNILLHEKVISERSIGVDEDWAKDNVDYINKYQSYQWNKSSEEYWITTGDGRRIKSLKELEENLPSPSDYDKDLTCVCEFKNGEFLSDEEGLKLKIRTIIYKYKIKRLADQNIIIDGEKIAKAIFKDVFTEEIKFVNSDGSII